MMLSLLKNFKINQICFFAAAPELFLWRNRQD